MNKELKPCPIKMVEIAEGKKPEWKGHYNLIDNSPDMWAIAGPLPPQYSKALLQTINDYNEMQSELQSLRAENERFKSVFEEITSPHYWFNYADALSTNMSMKINDLFLTALKDSNNE